MFPSAGLGRAGSRGAGVDVLIRGNGFSLPELLAVLALVGIAVAIGIPIVNEQVRIAEVRGTADQLALHLRAARMASVTRHEEIKFKIELDPVNKYSYTAASGKDLEVTTPDRVKLTAASSLMITFRQNGSVDATSSITLESRVSGARERWTATVNELGLATLVHERVN
jgi:prepilin-type N-terminal cleavage/methylation domain-containing protein